MLLDDGYKIVLVHGGSSEANALGETVGYPARFVTSPSGFSSRYTDRKTLEIFSMAVNGKVNTLLVEQLQILGVNAIGLSGVDGRLVRAKRKAAIRIIENGKRSLRLDNVTHAVFVWLFIVSTWTVDPGEIDAKHTITGKIPKVALLSAFLAITAHANCEPNNQQPLKIPHLNPLSV